MVYLIVDTSTDCCLIALVREGVITHEISAHHNNLSKHLLPATQRLIQSVNLTPASLTGIACGVGPGSYTGTRVGATVAKTLAFALQIPVKPFLSPLAFIPSCSGQFAYLLPTRAGPFFVLRGQSDGGGLLALFWACPPRRSCLTPATNRLSRHRFPGAASAWSTR